MSEKRRGLGKGLGALIPSAPANGRPVDVFFPDQRPAERAARGSYVVTQPRHEEPPATAESPDPAPTADSGTKKSAPAEEAAAAPNRSTSSGEATPKRPASKRAQIPADTLSRRRSAPSARSPASSAQSAAASAQRAAATPDTTSPDRGAAAPGSAGTSAQPAAPATDQSAASPDAAPRSPEPATDLVAVPGATFAQLDVTSIVANRRQPRHVFDEDELDELAASIREVGVLQPIIVRQLPAGEDFGYELIMGERRWRASELAGNETVPAIIRQVEDNALLRDALLENLHRSQLNPLEEAAAYQQLLEDFGCTHDELATRIARSRPQISNTLRLLKLPPLVQRRVAAGVLSAGHARALLGLSDAGAMERLAQRIVAEGLSVRSTEEIVALGDEPIEPEMRRRPRTSPHTAELNDLATKLADRFDTRVKIGMGQRKGRINIEFASVEDLNRILDVLAPTVEGLPATPAES